MATRYICGCVPSEKRGYSGDGVQGFNGTLQYTDVRYDEQGYEVCPEHGERLIGWRSNDPRSPHYILNGQGVPPTFVSPDKSVAISFDGDDHRDNRDPEEVYAEMKREKAQLTNGHG